MGNWRRLIADAHALLDRGDALSLVDAQLRRLYVSPAITRMLGWTPEELCDGSKLELTNADDAARVRPEFEALLREPGGTRTMVTRARHKNGTWRWIETTVTNRLSEPAIGALVSHTRDVTDTVLAREALEESRRRLELAEANARVLIESAPVSVLVHRDDRILYVNPAMARMLRVCPDELIGRSPLAVTPPDRRAVARERIGDLTAARLHAQTKRMETELLRSDGALVPVDLEAVKLEFDGGPAIVVFARDLSDERAMLSRLAASDRLASLGVLAAGVAHEINNPLTFLQTNLLVLARRLEGEPDVAPFLADAREGATRIQALVRDLRSFARPDAEQTTAVDLRDVVDSCVRMARSEVRARARLVVQLEELPLVAASASRLGQVFLNLLVNAAQAIPEGRADENEIRITAYRAASGRVVTEISDTGMGIEPSVLGHVFDPFFTTKPHGVGTGLGLSICHGIVRAMNGEITVESRVGRGSTFRVELPVWTEDGRAATSSSAPSSAPPLRRRIVVVDDERAIGDSLRMLLGMEHDVTAFTGGREALDRIRSGLVYDALLCDLMMPEMTGMQFYDELLDAAPDLAERVVFVTGGAFTPSSRRFLERVPNPRLEKPFDLDALHRALDAVAEPTNAKPAAP